ncbi:MAG: YihY/virulence factor BrkB family protein [Nocardioidaceae bacterium]|nr:YihY/virulence factor BrkB family protein [Nocardioidaceae bacterium]NUS51495.1 YihY/virulence factor BrkB family protein [Nocardioidaceae bacterium]
MAVKSEGVSATAGTLAARWEVARDTTWRLVVSTVGTCFRHRVTGLAAEAAFFALLSLPPLLFGLAGSIGYVFDSISPAQVEQVRTSIIEICSRALTPQTVDAIVRPTLNDVFEGGRFDVISVGFILALWSGSRALNVFVDTITIMYGLGGHRGIVKTRVLSFSLYVLGLVTGVVTLPLVVAGPGLVRRVVPSDLDVLNELYWPIVVVLCICFLATLYHVSVPVRTSWRYNVPGAALTMAMWIFGSYLLRWILTSTAGGSTSIYGPLAAPIVVLLWLYLLSIAVLIGAALNAAFDRVWPEKETARARMELVRRLRMKALLPRLRRDEEEQQRFPDSGDQTMVLQARDEREHPDPDDQRATGRHRR